MSTESGSTAAGERRRRAEDLAAREDSTSGDAGTSGEPDATRPLDTSGAHDTRRHDTEVLGNGDTRRHDTEVISTADNRRNDTQVLGTADTRRNDTEVTGTRDPNDAAYRTERSTPEQAGTAAGTAPGRSRRHDSGHDGARTGRDPQAQGLPNREALLAAERERFGGFKFGAAFFGWLTATGMVVLLSAAAAAIGAAVGVSTDTDLGAALDQAAANQSAGLIGAIITLAVLLLAYYAGGYVAGRMARFNGLKQGLAVWLWALVAAAVVIIVGLIFGNDIRSITQLNSVAPLPQDLGSISAGTWLAVLASVAVSLIGALLGGLAGMRFHRRVDRAQFPPVQETV